MSNENWNDDTIQFPRLIDELQAAGALTPEVMQSLCESMDLEEEQICELLERAQESFHIAKYGTMYYEIDGYWKDDKSEFSGYLVKSDESIEEDDDNESRIFFYGLTREKILREIECGATMSGGEDFVITGFSPVYFPFSS